MVSSNYQVAEFQTAPLLNNQYRKTLITFGIITKKQRKISPKISRQPKRRPP
ncbi:MAG: hypothetical protein MRERC_9c021 [Mycoplasmataceae bacterium RC_NB112A]|nr:MAG: hypothetical protein MRERC_9c021 [Mycoplasmataceae bacterium RC_NB112A]